MNEIFVLVVDKNKNKEDSSYRITEFMNVCIYFNVKNFLSCKRIKFLACFFHIFFFEGGGVGGDSCHPYIHLCNCCLILKCRKRS